jgi:uncharacterized metal-binding protein YceD (DUF177 family)
MNNYDVNFNEETKIDNLKKRHGNIIINLKDTERSSICKRLHLHKLDIFKIRLEYKRTKPSDIMVNYKILAEGEQKCVITLKPVSFKIEKLFIINFIDQSKIDLLTLEDEYVEPIINNKINFSEVVIQMFSSFLDPYPKINKGNIELESIYKNKLHPNKKKINPFEVLNNLNK